MNYGKRCSREHDQTFFIDKNFSFSNLKSLHDSRAFLKYNKSDIAKICYEGVSSHTDHYYFTASIV